MPFAALYPRTASPIYHYIGIPIPSGPFGAIVINFQHCHVGLRVQEGGIMMSDQMELEPVDEPRHSRNSEKLG